MAGDLDARLERNAAAPLVVAFSGGGDSLALLLAAKSWADRAGRRLIAVTVDHRLQPDGAKWAAWCQARAERLRVAHRTLVWEEPRPRSGLAAAARQARHGLLAEAARRCGGRVILMGHTADDCLEARAMRAAGSSVGAPRVWAPSPVWPAGHGVFLLRPLLTARRAHLRALLSELGEDWIDDPANLDPASLRARVRASHAAGQALGPETPRASPVALQSQAAVDAQGAIAIPRAALDSAPPAEARAFVAAALLCAAGTARPPRGASLGRLMSRVAGSTPFAATLAGARLAAGADVVGFRREPGRNPGGPILAADGKDVHRLVAWRLAAACGAIDSEAAIGRVAEAGRTP